jgi:hypothetical protein
VTLAPSAPPPPEGRRPDESQGPDFAGVRDLAEIAGLLLALGFSAWIFSEMGSKLGERVRARFLTD